MSALFLTDLVACGPDKPVPVPLVIPEDWKVVSGALDPYDARRPKDAFCDPAAIGPYPVGGEVAYDIDGKNCLFVTVAQPTRVPVYEGETMLMRLWHFELIGPTGTATVSVCFDGQPFFYKELAIPGKSGLDAPVWKAERDMPAGTPVQFHVSNHGSNSYSLIELSVGGPFPGDP